MKQIIITLGLVGLFTGALFANDNQTKNLWAMGPARIRLQVASCPTLACAKKEIDRLKAFNIQVQYTIREDRSKKNGTSFI